MNSITTQPEDEQAFEAEKECCEHCSFDEDNCVCVVCATCYRTRQDCELNSSLECEVCDPSPDHPNAGQTPWHELQEIKQQAAIRRAVA